MSEYKEQIIEKIAKQIFIDYRSDIYTPDAINHAWDNMDKVQKLGWLNKAHKLLVYVPEIAIVNREVKPYPGFYDDFTLYGWVKEIKE